MAKRIRIGVIYGGRSSEHPISVVSAGSVLAALDPAKYEIVTIGITQSGAWIPTEVDPRSLIIANRQLPQVAEPDQADQAASSELAGAPRELQLFRSSSAVAALDSVDVVIPMLHGAYGEDGTIQGLLEMAGVPYVGSGVLASAAAMDKVFAKIVLAADGIEVAPYLVAHRDRPAPDFEQLEPLGLPLFVKPARAGSSVGISKVSNLHDLPDALKLAFEFDSKALIEQAVLGRELECGVLQDADGTITASLPAEIRLHPDFDWYSFDAKYLDDSSDFDVPALIGDSVLAEVQRLSCQVFQALDCAGLARVDFFLTPEGRLVVNEVNTMPGFTSISMYPKMWAASGVSYCDLLDRLIATALAGR
ncbi:MAG: D-alanine--D-alanine ligase family protein [Jatrophihabitantaceae bacterium]